MTDNPKRPRGRPPEFVIPAHRRNAGRDRQGVPTQASEGVAVREKTQGAYELRQGRKRQVGYFRL